MAKKSKISKLRRITTFCNKCENSMMATEFFETACVGCCAPHTVTVEFLMECLTKSEHVELNKKHIAQRCPHYGEIMKIIEEN